MLEDQIATLTNQPYSYNVLLHFYAYDIVSCIIKRPYIRDIGVKASARSGESALTKALVLLDKVKTLDVKIPTLDKQEHIDGYYRETISDNIEVQFQRTYDAFVVTAI